MTREAFVTTFRRLARALQAQSADAELLDVYFEALSDLPADAVEQSAAALRRETRFFPTTGEWRERAQALHYATLERVVRDWDVIACPGEGAITCGRPRKHAPHEFVRARVPS